ncbi:hypothetical protein F4801DRAFT_530677 [Xylaria longipes]|nr:hypothetical protein F4801DRAFT_530677 [Xylaria longipes]
MDSIFGDSTLSATQSAYPVFTGVWTNWSYGKIRGATLTLTQSNGNLLIAFVALFASMLAGHIWKIIRFGLHLWNTSPEAHDALYHQQQALLRNSSTAGSSAFTLMELAWAWRRSPRCWRFVPLIVFTIALAVGLALASGFSARVAIGNEVLISGNNCGMPINPQGVNTTFVLTSFSPLVADFATSAAVQASQCYTNNPGGITSPACKTFINPRLVGNVDRNATCPFGDLCRSKFDNIFFDTGLLDSHKDFGINAPEEERFSWRQTMHCAVLRTDGHQNLVNISQDRSYIQYLYGDKPGSNFTYLASNDSDYLSRTVADSTAFADYTIGTFSALFTNGTLQQLSSFNPIPQLRNSGGDIYIYFLSANGVLFSQKTLDPWYQATHKLGTIGFLASNGSSVGGLVDLYGQDYPGSPLACTQKRQICTATPGSPQQNHCTPLGAWADTWGMAFINATDKASYDRLSWSLSSPDSYFASLSTVVAVLGGQSLLSRRSLSQGFQGPLPDDQWKLDLEYWRNIEMASWSKAFVQAATGLPSSYSEKWIRRPMNKAEVQLCQSQKIISTSHISFSVLGLSLLLAGGLLVVSVSLSIEHIARFLQRYAKLHPYSRLEWVSNGTLQLQRLAHEELGFGEWTGADETVPTTASHTQLARLDISDLRHPRLLQHSGRKEESRPSCPTNSESDAEEELIIMTEQTEMIPPSQIYQAGARGAR